MEQWCWVIFQCRGVLLIWCIVGQGPTALTVGAGGGCLDIFSLICHFSLLSPSLWETARYGLKYCLKGPLNPKQPTNQSETILKKLFKGQVKIGMDRWIFFFRLPLGQVVLSNLFLTLYCNNVILVVSSFKSTNKLL